MGGIVSRIGALSLSALAAAAPLPAHAQDNGTPPPATTESPAPVPQPAPVGGITNEGDIIVTARRRAETAQNTPVAITVLNDTLLERYGIKGIATIAQLTPGLITGEASGSVGGSISLRGIGSGDSQPFIDQAISLNVDGVPISSAQLLRAAQLDLKQIEVLRGPQALFFGKNSPGGIISISSADPGSRLEVLARGGYEFKAEEKYAELTVSTPLTETLGLRLAGRYSRMNGYIKVVTTDDPALTPFSRDAFPRQREAFLRGTLALKPSDALTVRLKGTLTDTKIDGGPSQYSDITACPYGVPQGAIDTPANCRNDGVIYTAGLSPQFLALNPLLGTNPDGFRRNKQYLATGTIDYSLSDDLLLTSVSGYYGIREDLASNGGYSFSSVNGFAVGFTQDQYSQELRLASSFDGPVNLLIGGFFEHRDLYTVTFIGSPDGQRLGQPRPAYERALESTRQGQDSSSIFGQLLWNPTEQVQITAGGRYTHEIKKLRDYIVTPSGGVPTDVTQDPRYPDTKLSFDNFSPEATISYKPVTDVMLFLSYKRGFKSGGFDAGYTAGAILANPLRDQTFDPEKVKGFEGGLKSTLLDRQLTFNLTGYWYDYSDLQVAVFDTTAQAFTTQNAAKARVRGIELETSLRPRAVPGFNLHLSAAYNDAKFREYLAACYNGQSPALGCNQVPNATGTAFTSQDLSGRQLRKAPKWAVNGGAYYEAALTPGVMASLSTDIAYSSGYDAGSSYQPLAYQSKFAKIDATFRLFSEDRRWELGVIGRNLTNKRNLVAGIDRTGTGGARGSLPTCATLAQTGCSRLSDIIGTPTLPRTVAVQLTYRY